MPEQNKDWNNYTERQRILTTGIAESLLSFFFHVEADKVHASVPRAELTDPSLWCCIPTAERWQGRGGPREWDFPQENRGGSPAGCPHQASWEDSSRTPSQVGSQAPIRLGMEDYEFQHSTPSTPYWLLFWQAPMSKVKMANELHRYLKILWGVLGCLRIYAVFPFPPYIFPPGLIVGLWLSSFIPAVSFVGCPHWCKSQNWGQQWKLCLQILSLSTTFSGRRNVIFTSDFQESFNKIKLSAVILPWYVPFFVLWADTFSSKTAEFTNKRRKNTKMMQSASCGLAMQKWSGRNNFLLFLPSRKKINEQGVFAGI